MIKKLQTILQNPLASGTLLMIGGSMGINVINYGYHLIMGRILGPSAYGALASIYSILYIISIIPQSASITVVKFISAAKTETARTHIYQGVTKLVQRVAIAGALILLIFAPFLQQFLNVNSLFAIVWLAPIFYFSIITTVNQAAMQGVLSFSAVVVTNLVSSVGKLLLGVLFIVIGWGLGGAIFGVTLGVFAAYVLSFRYISQLLQKDTLDENIFELNKFIRYSGPVIIQALAFTALFTIDLILVKHFFSDFDAGMYAALATLGKIIYFAASPITAVMFPIVSRRNAEGSSHKNVFLSSLGITAFVCFSLVAIYGLIPNLTISLLYGSKYLSAAPYLVWMGLFIALYTISQQIVNYFLSVDVIKIVYIPAIATVLQVVLIWNFHTSLLQVLQICTAIVTGITVLLLLVLTYNHKKYE